MSIPAKLQDWQPYRYIISTQLQIENYSSIQDSFDAGTAIKLIKIRKSREVPSLSKQQIQTQKETNSMNDVFFSGYLCVGEEVLPSCLHVLFLIDRLEGIFASTIIPMCVGGN